LLPRLYEASAGLGSEGARREAREHGRAVVAGAVDERFLSNAPRAVRAARALSAARDCRGGIGAIAWCDTWGLITENASQRRGVRLPARGVRTRPLARIRAIVPKCFEFVMCRHARHHANVDYMDYNSQ
jgi:hypothetical protein